MEAIFNGLWLIGEAASFAFLAYGASLFFSYRRDASNALLQGPRASTRRRLISALTPN